MRNLCKGKSYIYRHIFSFPVLGMQGSGICKIRPSCLYSSFIHVIIINETEMSA